jgi:hypothetical protein
MLATEPVPPQHSTIDIFIAIIGLVGGVVTAVVSNWDKLFGKGETIQAKTTYRPTGEFETELRYFLDVSGARKASDSQTRQLIQVEKMNELMKNPENAKEINKLFDVITKEAIRFDDVIIALLPVYQKHFTLAELQELNKFYSTETMQNMIVKLPLIAQDAAPIQVKLISDYYERLAKGLS